MLTRTVLFATPRLCAHKLGVSTVAARRLQAPLTARAICVMASAKPFFTVDSFTNKPFGGNPAAVLLFEASDYSGGFPPEEWMRVVAREMNLSETAFAVARAVPGQYDLRWLTPSVEVDLCGHATLATAHLIFEQSADAGLSELRFQTRSGELVVRRVGSKAAGVVGPLEMDFPLAAPREVDPTKFTAMAEAVGMHPLWVGHAEGTDDFIVEVEDSESVRSFKPDLGRLAAIGGRGVILTAAGAKDTDYDFVSRFFGPNIQIPEDPVTGSAHCSLGPYWAQKLGKVQLSACQCSARGGELTVSVVTERGRVLICGEAVTVISGQIRGPA